MKQQDAYKLLAAFMILIMIIVPVAYVVTSPRDTSQQTSEQKQLEKYNPELWVVNQPFFSISDALNMTPDGVVNADYADLESMTPQMVQWAKTQLPVPVEDVDSLYKSNTTKMYFAGLENNSFLLLSMMFPEKNDFDYIVVPGTNYILRRQDTGAINILGNPAIYAPDRTASMVMRIIYSTNKTTTAYDRYEGLLSKAEHVPFQTISSNVSFAKQFYIGVGEKNGTYERTAIYLNVNASTLKKLNQLKANSTQKGFTQYNITRSGNYTIVRITAPDLDKVKDESFS